VTYGHGRPRSTGSVTPCRGHLAHHHAVALALGPVVGEAFALVHRASAVVEEGRVLLPHTAGVVRERLENEGAEPIGNAPEEFATMMKAESARWAEIVKKASISID